MCLWCLAVCKQTVLHSLREPDRLKQPIAFEIDMDTQRLRTHSTARHTEEGRRVAVYGHCGHCTYNQAESDSQQLACCHYCVADLTLSFSHTLLSYGSSPAVRLVVYFTCFICKRRSLACIPTISIRQHTLHHRQCASSCVLVTPINYRQRAILVPVAPACWLGGLTIETGFSRRCGPGGGRAD